MTRVAAGFHVRDDDWILGRKLEALSFFCERIVVLLDRCEESTRVICQSFSPIVEVHVHENTLGLPDLGNDGPICEEGIMRQEVWDLLARGDPEWILLGDADEIPTPDIVRFLENPPDVDVVYLDWVQLYRTPLQHIAGPECIWSYEHPASAKKGALVRFDREKQKSGEYRYDLKKFRHTRLEPSPVSPQRHVETLRHLLVKAPKLLHWKWVNWERWDGSYQAGLLKYRTYWDGMILKPTPKEWLW